MPTGFLCNTHGCETPIQTGEVEPGPCPGCKQSNWVKLDVITAETRQEELKEVIKLAATLTAKLGCALPCCTHLKGDTTCIVVEQHRKLTKEELAKGWVYRPFSYYDPDRLCLICAAYWHAALARDALFRFQKFSEFFSFATHTPVASAR